MGTGVSLTAWTRRRIRQERRRVARALPPRFRVCRGGHRDAPPASRQSAPAPLSPRRRRRPHQPNGVQRRRSRCFRRQCCPSPRNSRRRRAARHQYRRQPRQRRFHRRLCPLSKTAGAARRLCDAQPVFAQHLGPPEFAGRRSLAEASRRGEQYDRRNGEVTAAVAQARPRARRRGPGRERARRDGIRHCRIDLVQHHYGAPSESPLAGAKRARRPERCAVVHAGARHDARGLWPQRRPNSVGRRWRHRIA